MCSFLCLLALRNDALLPLNPAATTAEICIWSFIPVFLNMSPRQVTYARRTDPSPRRHGSTELAV
ncbi:hypothetical protein NITMOv2_1578 [Nitrospira moscoviensis]|uniref:Uncharacterized protein n=1 Tax=Nitrospira moscoviensis TaxID=42253 RepID=A0A0K2GBN8_NITMO|nr:hypothetical protein NITMOv2_1578 [Nitrospira moscoviensis]